MRHKKLSRRALLATAAAFCGGQSKAWPVHGVSGGGGTAPTADFAVTFSVPGTARPLAQDFVGWSWDKEQIVTDIFRSTGLIALHNLLSPANSIRICGNSVNFGQYVSSAPGYNAGHSTYGGSPFIIGPSDIDRLASFAAATNAKVDYGFGNYAHGWSDETSNVAEAVHAATAFGSSHLGNFCVGNEPELGFGGGITNAQHLSFYYAMEAATGRNDIPYQGIDTALGPTTDGIYDYGIKVGPFANDLSVALRGNGQPILSFITKHFYGNFGGSMDHLDPAESMAAMDMDGLLPIMANPGFYASGTNPASTLPPLPMGARMNEVGNAHWDAAGVVNSWAAALWGIEFCRQVMLRPGFTGVNFHGGEGPLPDGSGYSPVWNDDYGIGLNSGLNVLSVQPTYYGMLAVTRLLPGNLLNSSVSVDPGEIAFVPLGSKKADNSYHMLLVNKSTTNTVVVTINPPATISSASSMLMTAPSRTSTTGPFTFGGASVGIDGSWSPSSTPLTIYSGNKLSVSIPPSSVQYVSAS